MLEHGIKVNPTINKQGNIQGFRFIHEASGADLKASEVDRNLKLNQLFSIIKPLNTKTIDYTPILQDYNLNTSAFSNIFSQIAFEDEENNTKKRKRRKNSMKY
ncbi:hypothetical protein [Polaribacter sp. NJDZ03]|uniref:hypothetical protein n=1 Tax=Polaribacter sp. NJDZ03 TaxID=2855841 RepID=UPI001C4A0638|nr:hypothetical protein [Polaribacter sp. NJDZ03]